MNVLHGPFTQVQRWYRICLLDRGLRRIRYPWVVENTKCVAVFGNSSDVQCEPTGEFTVTGVLVRSGQAIRDRHAVVVLKLLSTYLVIGRIKWWFWLLITRTVIELCWERRIYYFRDHFLKKCHCDRNTKHELVISFIEYYTIMSQDMNIQLFCL